MHLKAAEHKYMLVFHKPKEGIYEHCQCCSSLSVLLLSQALAVLHERGFAHVNLKSDKIMCKRLSDGSIHCRITDLGSVLREEVSWSATISTVLRHTPRNLVAQSTTTKWFASIACWDVRNLIATLNTGQLHSVTSGFYQSCW